MCSTTSAAKNLASGRDMKSLLDKSEEKAADDDDVVASTAVPQMGRILRYYAAGQIDQDLLTPPVINALTVTLRQQNSPDSAPVTDGDVGLVIILPASSGKTKEFAWSAIEAAGATRRGPSKAVGAYATAELAAAGVIERSMLTAAHPPVFDEGRVVVLEFSAFCALFSQGKRGPSPSPSRKRYQRACCRHWQNRRRT